MIGREITDYVFDIFSLQYCIVIVEAFFRLYAGVSIPITFVEDTIREQYVCPFAQVDLNWKDYVEIDKKYFRPTEVDILIGDNTKARQKLGWEPKLSFEGLVKLMVESDVARLEKSLRGLSPEEFNNGHEFWGSLVNGDHLYSFTCF